MSKAWKFSNLLDGPFPAKGKAAPGKPKSWVGKLDQKIASDMKGTQ